MQDIDWKNTRLLIFDVDGTLYDQQRLRRRMAMALAAHYLPRPWKLSDLSVLSAFRKEREKNRDLAVDNLEQAQYEWCSLKTGVPADRVRKLVSSWMFDFPLRYLQECVFPGLQELFTGSVELGIPVAVLSDYPAEEKLRVMGLKADFVVSATQPEVNCLKPAPGGLTYIAGHYGLNPQQCIYIGDRLDTDGEAAERAGMNFLLAEREQIYKTDLFTQILNRLDRASGEK
jgi:phosphoglycolate phosphatase/putative hydrolase of the HAD superfamily